MINKYLPDDFCFGVGLRPAGRNCDLNRYLVFCRAYNIHIVHINNVLRSSKQLDMKQKQKAYHCQQNLDTYFGPDPSLRPVVLLKNTCDCPHCLHMFMICFTHHHSCCFLGFCLRFSTTIVGLITHGQSNCYPVNPS